MDETTDRQQTAMSTRIISLRHAQPPQRRRLADYPHVPRSYLNIARRLSSLIVIGPPICDELMDFLQHLFTEEEASVVQHLHRWRAKTADDLARAEDRPVDQIQPILDALAHGKRSIACVGTGDGRKYRLMPIFPGIYEMVLIGHSPETLTPWHRRFAELFDALFHTRYSVDYVKHPLPFMRVLPVNRTIQCHPLALPSDRLETILDRFKVFGVGQCQCRMSAIAQGRGCGKPLRNCAFIGDWAKRGIRNGWLKQVSKHDLLEIKLEAESHGLVNWIMNVDSSKGQTSCSCCGCCCNAMRQIRDFNAPGVIAPPHFLPHVDFSRCNYCGHCASRCPMSALSVNAVHKTWTRQGERCIGCGLCAISCDARHAIRMEAVPDYETPPNSYFKLLARMAPNLVRNALHVWRRR